METPVRIALFMRVLMVAALASLAAWPTETRTETRAPLFTAEQEACFGRVYDAAHLKAHPKQKVASFHVLRSLERRRTAENWTPDERAETIRNFKEDGQMSVTALVTFRDRKGAFYNHLVCNKETAEGMN